MNPKELESFIQNQYGNKGISGLVELMQLNYDMRGAQANVSAAGNEIIVNMTEPDIVEAFETLEYIVSHSLDYSHAEFEQAHQLLQQMRNDIGQVNHNTPQDRAMFINARVSKVTFKVGGAFVVSVPIK